VQKYIVKRLGQTILTLFAVSIIVFGLARLTGDPADVLMPMEATQEDRDRILEHWGLDEPLHVQYAVFIGNALQGDFGESLQWPGRDALDLVLTRIGATVQLGAAALLFALVVAVPIGVLSAVHKNSRLDFAGKAIALLGQSLPHFWIGIIFMWIFAVHLRWLPTSGRGTVWHMIMPAIVIGWFQVAALMRLMRSSMLDALDSEYIKLARIKGVPEVFVIWKHALRNATVAPLTYFGIMISYLVVGSITTETVFSWPGVGLLIVNAVTARDFQVVQAVALVFAIVIILVNLAVDILYAYLDPRIRYE
jgi:peptide/nickel transport system permease protein